MAIEVEIDGIGIIELDDSFGKLSPDEQNATIEDIVQQVQGGSNASPSKDKSDEDTSGWGSFIGGTGGAGAGALAGAAAGSVVPGIGTVLGGIGGALLGGAFGGAAGGAAGEYAEQKLTGKGDREDVYDAAITEGAWGALPGVGGLIGKGGSRAIGKITGKALGKAAPSGSELLAKSSVPVRSTSVPNRTILNKGKMAREAAAKRPVGMQFAPSKEAVLEAATKKGQLLGAVEPGTKVASRAVRDVAGIAENLLPFGGKLAEGLGKMSKYVDDLPADVRENVLKESLRKAGVNVTNFTDKKFARFFGKDAFKPSNLRELEKVVTSTAKKNVDNYKAGKGPKPYGDLGGKAPTQEVLDKAKQELYKEVYSQLLKYNIKTTGQIPAGLRALSGVRDEVVDLVGGEAEQKNLGGKISKIYNEGYTAPGQAYAIAKSMGYQEGGEVAGWADESQKYAKANAGVASDNGLVLDLLPIVGDIKTAYEVAEEIKKDNTDWYIVGTLAGAGILGLIPGIGDAAASAIKAGAKKAFKPNKTLADELGSGDKISEYGSKTLHPGIPRDKLIADQIKKDIGIYKPSNIKTRRFDPDISTDREVMDKLGIRSTRDSAGFDEFENRKMRKGLDATFRRNNSGGLINKYNCGGKVKRRGILMK